MDVNTVMLIAREGLYVTALVASPILLSALALGLLIGILQAATQIQEMTLSFIPKLIGMSLALVLAGGWMVGVLVEFTGDLMRQIPFLIG